MGDSVTNGMACVNTEWVTAQAWDNITQLDKLKAFTGIVDSFTVDANIVKTSTQFGGAL